VKPAPFCLLLAGAGAFLIPPHNRAFWPDGGLSCGLLQAPGWATIPIAALQVPSARVGHGAVAIDDHIYVVGGSVPNGMFLADVIFTEIAPGPVARSEGGQ
jgi:hypothetical protein